MLKMVKNPHKYFMHSSSISRFLSNESRSKILHHFASLVQFHDPNSSPGQLTKCSSPAALGLLQHGQRELDMRQASACLAHVRRLFMQHAAHLEGHGAKVAAVSGYLCIHVRRMCHVYIIAYIYIQIVYLMFLWWSSKY